MLKIYVIVLAAMSVLCAAAFGIDKIKSKGDASRTPEIVLLSLMTFGGAVGGLVGMYVFRHKTNPITKFHFTITLFVSLAVQAFLLYKMIGGAANG